LTGYKEVEAWDLLLLLPHLDYGESDSWMVAGTVLALTLVSGAVAIITAFKLVHGAYFKAVDPERVGDIRQVTKSLTWQTNYRIPDTLPVKIIRGVSDEASLALSAGALASRLSLFLNEYIVQLFVGIMVISALLEIAFFLIRSVATLPTFIDNDPLNSAWLLLIVIGVPIVLVARILAMLLKLVYGRELLLSPPRCEIDTSGAPDVNRNATLTTLRPSAEREGLHHSIYDRPLCQEIVADYIAAHAAHPS
jgi:hypothetical protein